MSNYLKALAKKVDDYLIAKNLSAREFADLCGISNSSVSSFLKKPSESDLRFSTIEAMASALGLTPVEAITSPALSGLAQSPIEARLAALESKVFSESSTPEPEEFLRKEGPSGYLLPEFEKLAEEIERDLNVDLKEKRVRKKGNG